jgi:hypothetical protein
MAAIAGQRSTWPWIVLVWAVLGCLLVLNGPIRNGGAVILSDTDDAMRLAEVSDLLEGQPWQDLTQYRDNAPFGSVMHWSRLIDAPIALLALAAKPFAGGHALDVAAVTWPLLLLLCLFFVSIALAQRLVGPDGRVAALILPVLSVPLLAEFSPARVDHHNVQILICGCLLLATVAGRLKPLPAAAAGFLAATSLAIGIETLHLAAVSVAAFALFWVFDPQRCARPTATFAIALAAGTAAHFLVATPPALYTQPACDALSIVYVDAACLGSLALLGAVFAGRRLQRPLPRLLLIGGLGAAALGITLALFPDCLRGPYGAVNAKLYDQMLGSVDEVRSLWQRLQLDVPSAIALAFGPIAALAVTAWIVRKQTGERRIDWLVLGGFLAVALLMTLMQIRGARLAALFAIPPGVWLIGEARSIYLARQRLTPALGMVASWLLFAGIAQFGFAAALSAGLAGPARAAAPAQPAQKNCTDPRSFAELAALPSGRVIAPEGLGPYILYYTPHSIVSAGYHRNLDGFRDVLAFFADGAEAAEAIAKRRGLNYLVTCEGMRSISGVTTSQWTWLVPIASADATLQIYRIDP